MKIFDGLRVILLISIICATQTSAKQIQTYVVNYETPSARKSAVLVSAEFDEVLMLCNLYVTTSSSHTSSFIAWESR
jgi:hypothetical protein